MSVYNGLEITLLSTVWQDFCVKIKSFFLFPHAHIQTTHAVWNQTCTSDTFPGLWRAPTPQLNNRGGIWKVVMYLFACFPSFVGVQIVHHVFSPCTALLSLSSISACLCSCILKNSSCFEMYLRFVCLSGPGTKVPRKSVLCLCTTFNRGPVWAHWHGPHWAVSLECTRISHCISSGGLCNSISRSRKQLKKLQLWVKQKKSWKDCK